MSTAALRAGVVAMVLAGLAVGPAAAQRPVQVTIVGMGMRMHLVSETVAATEELDGFVVGGEARVRLWRSELGIRYLSGTVTRAAGEPGETVVDAEAMVGSRPTDWLTVKAGPHVRSYATTAGPERSILWEGRLRAEGRLVGPTLRSYVEAWRAFTGSATLTSVLGSGQGIEGGLIFELPSAYLTAQVGYRVDRSSRPEPSELHTAESLFVTIGFGYF